LGALKDQFIGNPQRTMTGMSKAVIQDGLFDSFINPVGVRASGSGHPINKTG